MNDKREEFTVGELAEEIPHGWMNAYSRLVQGAFTNSQAIGAAVGHALVRSAAAGVKPTPSGSGEGKRR